MSEDGIVRPEAGIQKFAPKLDAKYHDLVIHGVVHGTNTLGWRDMAKKMKLA